MRFCGPKCSKCFEFRTLACQYRTHSTNGYQVESTVHKTTRLLPFTKPNRQHVDAATIQRRQLVIVLKHFFVSKYAFARSYTHTQVRPFKNMIVGMSQKLRTYSVNTCTILWVGVIWLWRFHCSTTGVTTYCNGLNALHSLVYQLIITCRSEFLTIFTYVDTIQHILVSAARNDFSTTSRVRHCLGSADVKSRECVATFAVERRYTRNINRNLSGALFLFLSPSWAAAIFWIISVRPHRKFTAEVLEGQTVWSVLLLLMRRNVTCHAGFTSR